MDKRVKHGSYGEHTVSGYLQALGYNILAKNYKKAHGEIDIIANDKGCIVFIEVKYRRNTSFGHPIESITKKKAAAIINTAHIYLNNNNLEDNDCRFDVIEVFGQELLEINHIKNAFWES